ncbi:MAG: proton-conducting transporter membrane subunit [Acidimicrobiia bacterium]|nr:proton-conducting transporter membrane subunit [Acidimicrobiia bacterium]
MMMLLVGLGDEVATFYGVVLLVAHALFKASLFLVVGAVDHEAHSRDLRVLDRLGPVLPVAAFSVLAVASMAGIPPLLGFIAKEGAFEALLHSSVGGWGSVGLVVFVTGSIMTFAYGARFLWGAFGPAERHETAADEPAVGPADVHRPVPGS